MSYIILSPPASEVIPPLESLSPPPTPIAKRGGSFSRSSNTLNPTPIYFPTSWSRLGSAHHPSTCSSSADKDATAENQIALLSRPVPNMQLVRRSPGSGASTLKFDDDEERRKIMSQIPMLPLYSHPETSSQSVEASVKLLPPPSLDASKRSGNRADRLCNANSVVNQQAVKLPSFQRKGLHHATVTRRNSYVARSA